MVSDRRSFFANVLIGLGLLLLGVVNIAPLFWGVLTSFKPEAAIIAFPPNLFDFKPTLDNYAYVLDSGFLTGMRNSALYAFAAITLGLIAASLAAFGFDRYQFLGRSTLFLVVVASIPLAVGAAALLVPNYLFFTRVGMTNHWFTLPLIYGVHSLPIAIWIIKGSMETIPRELDEAAYIDGCSAFGVFWRIVLPLCRPALGAAGLLMLIHAWNEFVAGSVMVDATELKPIQPLLYAYIDFFGRQWGPLTAAATLAILPIFLIYGFFGRLLISGMTRGAVKG